MRTLRYFALSVVVLTVTFAAEVRADRLRDIVEVMGARSNQLVGYGIVVGLNSTGDGAKAEFTLQSVAAMLRRLGVRVDPKKIKLKNAAAVIVTADLPAFTRWGQRIDVLVSSLGDAKSLRGGTLIQTPMLGADRKVYAVAQGPLSVGGFSAKGGSGSSKTSGHPTVGRIPSGAVIENEVPTTLDFENTLRLSLKTPDPTTAARAATAINERLEGPHATAEDPGLISVRIPASHKGKSVELLALIGDVEVIRDTPAKIVINERSGTVVVGSSVQLRSAAIAHGGLTVEIHERTQVSQPPPVSLGETIVTGESSVSAETAYGDLHLVPVSPTVGDLVNALNSLGVKPSDLIIIFQSLSAVGAISADIEVQ
ncbi:MAG: flagellar basal body P-ring protein FlgI [Proteobacteria bacterium]|nr:flagellar basal body P-ring protein FlgI [Pseudomonadota bacterium]